MENWCPGPGPNPVPWLRRRVLTLNDTGTQGNFQWYRAPDASTAGAVGPLFRRENGARGVDSRGPSKAARLPAAVRDCRRGRRPDLVGRQPRPSMTIASPGAAMGARGLVDLSIEAPRGQLTLLDVVANRTPSRPPCHAAQRGGGR